MKKILSLISGLVFAMCLSAQVGYLIPYTADVNFNSIGNVYGYLPSESSGSVEESPEQKAYDWFNNDYINAAGKKFFTVKDIKEGALLSAGVPTVAALWINVDRVGYSLGDFDAMFNDDFKTAVANYVKAGGNLYLSKQATRLVTSIGRCSWWPHAFANGGYGDGNDTWNMTDNFCANYNRHDHAMMKYVENYSDGWHFPLTSGEGTYKRTNNNSLWDDWGAYGISENGCDAYPDGDLKDKNIRVHKFETAQNCQILGGFGHTTGMDCAGFIEFFPNGDFKGTVVAMGLAAYQWGASNTAVYNVKNLTKGILDYLSVNAGLAWNEETIPASGAINTQHIMTAHANAGFTIRYGADDPLIANIGDMNGNIYFNYFGNATFTATATGDGWTAPKSATATIHSAAIPVNGGDQNVKYAYVLPYSLHTMSNYDNEESLRPDFEAANWFYDQYIANEVGGEHGCFVRPSDLASLNPAIKVLWIHNDHVGQASDDYYSDLGGDTFRDNLAAFVNAGGHVFVSKQATRLIGDLGHDIAPKYENGGYSDINETWRVGNKWNLSGTEIDRSTHRVYSDMGTNTTIMAAGRHTNNNCVWDNFDGLPGSNDAGRISQYEENHKCRILGAWGHYDKNNVVSPQLDCAGFVEYYPQEEGQGTIIAMGLAAFHWANPTNELKTLTRNTLSYLNFLNARPCAIDGTTPMETKLAENGFYPSNPTSFLTVHPVCENIAASYTLIDPNNIARIQGNVQVGEETITQLQFKEAGKAVTLHITLTETRNDVNWPTGTYEYDRAITFAYADSQAAQKAVNEDLSSDGIDKIEEQMAMRLHPNIRGLDSVSYTVVNNYNSTGGQAVKVKDGDATRLCFTNGGSVQLLIKMNETDWVEAWPMGEKDFTKIVTFSFSQPEGPTFSWPEELDYPQYKGKTVTLPATLEGLPITYSIKSGGATVDNENHKVTFTTTGPVTIRASVTETKYLLTWPIGEYTSDKAEISVIEPEMAYMLPDNLSTLQNMYDGEQPEYNAAIWFKKNYIDAGKGCFVRDYDMPYLYANGVKVVWVNLERLNMTTDDALFAESIYNNIKSFIQAGGNVLLTKQATRYAYLMDRIGYAPEFNAGGYVTENFGAQRSVATRMGISADEVLDKSNHRLYADMLSWTDTKNVYLVGETCKKTYNYCSWENFFTDGAGAHAYENNNIQRLKNFETAWNATVFGIRGNIVDYCYSDVVEFKATGVWQGRILTIGSAAYQWGSDNPTAELDNVKKLTANSLSYLLDEPLVDKVYTRNDLTPGIYGTICFDYAVEAGHIEGAEIYELTSFNATKDGVILTQVDAMVAGRPYFFLATANELRLTYNGQRVAAGSYHGLVGHIGETTLHITPNDNNYILYNNELLLVDTENIELLSYRAYINKYNEIPAYSKPTSNAPRRIMAIEPPHNAPTGLETVEHSAQSGSYDIMGRKVNNPQSAGFYIINGKKVIITQ